MYALSVTSAEEAVVEDVDLVVVVENYAEVLVVLLPVLGWGLGLEESRVDVVVDAGLEVALDVGIGRATTSSGSTAWHAVGLLPSITRAKTLSGCRQYPSTPSIETSPLLIPTRNGSSGGWFCWLKRGGETELSTWTKREAVLMLPSPPK